MHPAAVLAPGHAHPDERFVDTTIDVTMADYPAEDLLRDH
jgi:hypothetical protein